MTTLMNKTAIVTGASSGIGYATAKLFAREGANLVVAARRADGLNALVAEIEQAGGRAVAVAGDVRDEGLARALVETAVDAFGGLDIAFNNAGTNGEMGPTPEVSLEGWNEALAVNLTAAFLGAKYQIPAMLDRGAGRLRQALGPEHPAVLAAEGRLPPELLQRARDLLLARLAQG